MALSGELRHERSRLGPEPRFRRRARALKREVPRGEPRPPGDRSRADAQLGRVLVATRQDALGKAVRGEEHLHRLGRGESLQGLRYALRDQIQELGMITPAAHQRGLQPTGCRIEQLLLVRADRHRRVVRGQHDADRAPMTLRQHPLHHVADVRVPVTHAHVDGEPLAKHPLHAGRLRFGELADRGAPPDPGVSGFDLVDELRAGRPATAYVEQVGLDLIQASRSAIGHQQDRDLLTRHEPTRPRPGRDPQASPGGRRARG